MSELVARHAFLTLVLHVGEPVEFGTVAGQVRRMIPLLGGTVSGEYTGKVIPGGADWQLLGPDGQLEIQARYGLELDAGRVEIRSDGLRSGSPEVLAKLATGALLPASDYYFRTAIRFHTASPRLAHLNRLLAISVGERLQSEVRLSIHQVL